MCRYDRMHARSVVVAVAVFAALLIPQVADASGGRFTDDDNSVFESDIEWLAATGITRGCDTWSFCPDDPLTRAQFATFIRRAFVDFAPEPSGESTFDDISQSVHSSDIEWLATTGITRGCSEGRFCPDSPLTRGEFAAFMRRTLGNDIDVTDSQSFEDTDGHVFASDAGWLAGSGITRGCGDGSDFCPDDTLARGQMAAFTRRAFDALGVDPPSYDVPEVPNGLDDDFETEVVDLLSGDSEIWRVYNAEAASILDIGVTRSGSLVIVPREELHNGWYADHKGPYVYQEVRGDFTMEITLSVLSATNPIAGSQPGPGYNSGGIVVRDVSRPGDNWVMYNMGNQDVTGYQREVKTTVNSSSVLNLYAQAATRHRLMVCRTGSEIHYFQGSADGDEWTEEVSFHDRPDFGETLQVGLVATAWSGSPAPFVDVELVAFGEPGHAVPCPITN